MTVNVSLPTDDRRRAYEFYRGALDLPVVGVAEADGLPEPLRFALGNGVCLMLVPRTGFGWVVAGNEVAAPGSSECMLGLEAATPAEVDAVIARAVAAGATLRTPPGPQRWGYAGAFADPDGHLWMVAVPFYG